MTLAPDDREAVQALRRAVTLLPAECDRVERTRLSAAGWSPPRIAAHLGCHANTVRLVLKRFREHGPASRRQRPPRGAAPPTSLARPASRASRALARTAAFCGGVNSEGDFRESAGLEFPSTSVRSGGQPSFPGAVRSWKTPAWRIGASV